MSFELILPFLRPIEPLLLDESVSEIMGNPDGSWWSEREGVVQREAGVKMDANSPARRLGSHRKQDGEEARC